MKESAVILNWTGTLAPAENELTDQEIVTKYGRLMRAAILAFREDPSYVVEMAESAASLRSRREARMKAVS